MSGMDLVPNEPHALHGMTRGCAAAQGRAGEAHRTEATLGPVHNYPQHYVGQRFAKQWAAEEAAKRWWALW